MGNVWDDLAKEVHGVSYNELKEKPKEFWIRDNKKEYGETAEPHFSVFPFREGVEGNLIKVSEVDGSLAYNQLLADARKLQRALIDLKERHKWHPDMGECICPQHQLTEQVLKQFTEKYGPSELEKGK